MEKKTNPATANADFADLMQEELEYREYKERETPLARMTRVISKSRWLLVTCLLILGSAACSGNGGSGGKDTETGGRDTDSDTGGTDSGSGGEGGTDDTETGGTDSQDPCAGVEYNGLAHVILDDGQAGEAIVGSGALKGAGIRIPGSVLAQRLRAKWVVVDYAVDNAPDGHNLVQDESGIDVTAVDADQQMVDDGTGTGNCIPNAIPLKDGLSVNQRPEVRGPDGIRGTMFHVDEGGDYEAPGEGHTSDWDGDNTVSKASTLSPFVTANETPDVSATAGADTAGYVTIDISGTTDDGHTGADVFADMTVTIDGHSFSPVPENPQLWKSNEPFSAGTYKLTGTVIGVNGAEADSSNFSVEVTVDPAVDPCDGVECGEGVCEAGSCTCNAGAIPSNAEPGTCADDPCDPDPCNGNACSVDSADQAVCEDPCEGVSCGENASCNGEGDCECDPGTTPVGDGSGDCEVPITDLCESNTCNDGNSCNGSESCNPIDGSCESGTPVSCDDGNPCTIDSCVDPEGNCDNTPDVGAGCNDGNPDTIGDQCNASGACVGVEVDCTSDAQCDNGNPCDGEEVCGSGNTCESGTPISCDDGDACTTDSCDPSDGSCSNDFNDPNDGEDCNGVEACDPLTGDTYLATAPMNCGDGNECTTDSCTNSTCDNDPAPMQSEPCNDGDDHTIGDTCNAGSCEGTPVDCIGDGECDNENACDGVETCESGSCVSGTPVVCNDGLSCTDDICNTSDGSCSFDPAPHVGDVCDDQNASTVFDECKSNGQCAGEVPECFTAGDCSGADQCHTASCDSNFECQTSVTVGASCNDGDAGTINDTCQSNGVCEGDEVPAPTASVGLDKAGYAQGSIGTVTLGSNNATSCTTALSGASWQAGENPGSATSGSFDFDVTAPGGGSVNVSTTCTGPGGTDNDSKSAPVF